MTKPLKLSYSSYPSFNEMLSTLVSFNYKRVDMVFEPGDFSVKGGIIDIYPSSHQDPIRCEYDFDQLERLSVFHV